MAMATKNFYGEVGGESIQKLYRFLDPSLKTYEERLKQCNKALYEDEDGLVLKEVLVSALDDDRIKVNINSTDSITSETNYCKLLESFADYLLNTPEAKQLKDEDNQKIVVLDNIKISKEESRTQSLNVILGNGDSEDNLEIEEVLCIEKNNDNYKKQIVQKIFSRDFENPKLMNYIIPYKQMLDDAEKEKSEINKEIDLNNSLIEESKDLNYIKYLKTRNYELRKRYRFLNSASSEIDYDMIKTKDCMLGTIYFKAITHSMPPNDYGYDLDKFDYWDKNLIRLLAMVSRPITEFGEIYMNKFNSAFDKLVNNGVISEEDAMILEAYRNDRNMYDLADKLETTYQNIYKRVTMALNLVQRQMIEDYELDYYYTEKVRGNWKKCSKCGEIYPRNEYYWNKDKGKPDGFKYYCRKCHANMQK